MLDKKDVIKKSTARDSLNHLHGVIRFLFDTRPNTAMRIIFLSRKAKNFLIRFEFLSSQSPKFGFRLYLFETCFQELKITFKLLVA